MHVATYYGMVTQSRWLSGVQRVSLGNISRLSGSIFGLSGKLVNLKPEVRQEFLDWSRACDLLQLRSSVEVAWEFAAQGVYLRMLEMELELMEEYALFRPFVPPGLPLGRALVTQLRGLGTLRLQWYPMIGWDESRLLIWEKAFPGLMVSVMEGWLVSLRSSPRVLDFQHQRREISRPRVSERLMRKVKILLARTE